MLSVYLQVGYVSATKVELFLSIVGGTFYYYHQHVVTAVEP